MSEVNKAATGGDQGRAQWLRAVIYVCVAAQVLLWLGLIVTIARHTNPKGDGMEWVAMAPASIILALGIGPALAFRRERGLLWLGALLAFAGLIAGGALFLEILREFAEAAAR